MRTIRDLQSALLDWFWNEPDELKTFSSVQNLCISLFQQFYPNEDYKYAKYKILHPLLRIGVIEFYGNDKYALSPTCALLSDNIILAINLPESIKTELGIVSSPVSEYLGLTLYHRSAAVSDALKRENVPFQNFLVEQLFAKLPTLDSIILSWEDGRVTTTDRFVVFKDKWISYQEDGSVGVFKKSNLAYAQRLCKFPCGAWKIIPESKQNPDAFSLAVLWAKTKSVHPLKAIYNRRKSTISIHEPIFPLLLERLLIVNSLLHPSPVVNVSQRQYYLTGLQFTKLNNFLENSITVYE